MAAREFGLFYWVCAADLSDPLPHYSLYCGRGAWVYFTGYVPLVSQIPCPTIVYTVANCRRKAYLPPKSQKYATRFL